MHSIFADKTKILCIQFHNGALIYFQELNWSDAQSSSFQWQNILGFAETSSYHWMTKIFSQSMPLILGNKSKLWKRSKQRHNWWRKKIVDFLRIIVNYPYITTENKTRVVVFVGGHSPVDPELSHFGVGSGDMEKLWIKYSENLTNMSILPEKSERQRWQVLFSLNL